MKGRVEVRRTRVSARRAAVHPVLQHQSGRYETRYFVL